MIDDNLKKKKKERTVWEGGTARSAVSTTGTVI